MLGAKVWCCVDAVRWVGAVWVQSKQAKVRCCAGAVWVYIYQANAWYGGGRVFEIEFQLQLVLSLVLGLVLS